MQLKSGDTIRPGDEILTRQKDAHGRPLPEYAFQPLAADDDLIGQPFDAARLNPIRRGVILH